MRLGAVRSRTIRPRAADIALSFGTTRGGERGERRRARITGGEVAFRGLEATLDGAVGTFTTNPPLPS